MAAKKTSKSLSFEEGLSRLENIAEQMEKGEVPLEELLKLYEEGIKLSEELTQKLNAAEGRMLEVRAGTNGMPVISQTDVVKQQNMLDQLNEMGDEA